MRLVIWNSRYGMKAGRAERLADLRPDIAVLPEADQAPVWPDEAAPNGFAWDGSYDHKGLGAATFGEWSMVPAGAPRVPWVLPIQVKGPQPFLLLATWTVSGSGRPGYPAQVAAAIEAYREELAAGSGVLAGDLNCSAHTADPRQHLANVAELRSLGLVSAYHAFHDIEASREDPGTLFWMWKRDRPYHCDLAFVPEAWAERIRSVELGTFDDWVGNGTSDHVPVAVDIDHGALP